MALSTEDGGSEEIVANFEELVTENQIQTATDLLVTAEPEDQVLVISETRPELLEHFVEALDHEDKLEVTEQLVPEAHEQLVQVLARVAAALPAEGLMEQAPAAAGGAGDEIDESPWRMDFAIVDGRLRRTTPGLAAVTVYSDPTGAV